MVNEKEWKEFRESGLLTKSFMFSAGPSSSKCLMMKSLGLIRPGSNSEAFRKKAVPKAIKMFLNIYSKILMNWKKNPGNSILVLKKEVQDAF